MTVAIVALVAALGGTAIAATELMPRNSVGHKQIQKGAVRSSDVKNKGLRFRDLKNGARKKLKGETGPQGPRGPAGPQGQTGPQGETGPEGPSGTSALNRVPSGKTIRGAVGADFHAADNDASDFGVDVSLPMQAANNLGDGEVNVNVLGWTDGGGQTAPTTTDTNPNCTGTPAVPTAPAGEVCIYVAGADHAFNVTGFSILPGTGESPYGFKLKWDASQEGDSFRDATWAYTAP